MRSREILGSAGPLVKSYPAFELRSGQIEMAGKIDELLASSDRTLIAEAGTGTGKTASYLVPAIQLALDQKKKTVISTSNKALQDQVVRKDIPQLLAAMGADVSFSVLKGFSNYGCHYQADKRKRLKGLKAQVDEWLRVSETGDRSGAPLPIQLVWEEISTDADSCLRHQCEFFSSCFVFKAKARARESSIVVTNHHLLLLEMKLRAAKGGESLLPDFDFLVIDEADRIVDVARSVFGAQLSRAGLRRLLSQLGEDVPELQARAAELLPEVEDLWSELEDYIRRKYRVRFMEPGWLCASRLQRGLAGLSDDLDELYGEWKCRVEIDPVASIRLYKMTALGSRLRVSKAALEDFSSLSDDSSSVYYARKVPDGWSLVKERIRLAEVAGAILGSSCYKTLLTSATLTTGSDGFGPLISELGLDPALTSTLVVESPFDYVQQARLLLPQDLGPYDKPEFSRNLAGLIDGIAIALGGRTMALFTNWKNLRAVEELLRAKRSPYELLVQHDGMPVAELVERMRTDPAKGYVLLGTASFWKGVDIPGNALQAVVVEKFPFPPREDPVMDWYEKHEQDVFMRRMMPSMVLDLRQGVGRLIRTRDDVGLMVICDERAEPRSGKFYGRKALAALPPAPRLRSVEDAIGFIRAKGRLKVATT